MTVSTAKHRQETLEPFESHDDFLRALHDAIEEQSGVSLMGEELQEAGRNVNHFLTSFL